MRTTLIPNRWEEIIEFVEAHGSATVEQIALEMSISEATVRRDLARIDSRGLVKRTHGGAEAVPHVRVGQTLADSQQRNAHEKELIGMAAAKLISPGDTIMIDGGITTLQVARHMYASNVTAVTSSLDIAYTLGERKDAKVVVIGGELDLLTRTMSGPSAEEHILGLSANKAILGADAISPEHGISSPSPLTARNKKAMVLRSREVIVVADYSKIGRFALYSVSYPEKIRTLVTDSKAPEDILHAFRMSGVEVIVAKADH